MSSENSIDQNASSSVTNPENESEIPEINEYDRENPKAKYTTEEWNDFIKVMDDYKKIILKIMQKKDISGQPGWLWFQEQFIAFSQRAKENVPGCESYAGYHIFGSSPRRSESVYLDLPGEYSAITFFENLDKELDALEKEKTD
ncbi:MAG: hypothetical protein WC745_03760 [Patescibacteria group bacterium]|jgi:hypothetical protein